MYQHLLSYWNEVMQDDIYIISCDGWKAETYRVRQENSNKKLVDKGWTCDLVPKELVINRFFEKEKIEIEKLNNNLETCVSQYLELEEEHGAEEAALYEVSKKTDAVANLDEFTDLAISTYFPELHRKQNELSDNLEEQTNLLIEQVKAVFDGLKNAKGIVTKTNVQKAYKGMDEMLKIPKYLNLG